ncbi:hypothetical protein HPB47_003861 [Ixodes persulcatus]|uniref:Uncharacterized protein n=1 Tax=Ixodes persulcatus TaxID=34615 RepID=A0AC60PHF2_IXOPE|nr:hypothetical protein HPB47_003861 [Ixodes persulcatus]
MRWAKATLFYSSVHKIHGRASSESGSLFPRREQSTANNARDPERRSPDRTVYSPCLNRQSEPKRETAQTKAKPTGMTIHRSQEVPESDLLGAKPKKPPRTTTTVKPEHSASSTYSNASSSNKTFTKAPPFRNNPRVYSSTVLNDFIMAGKQGLAENTSGNRGHLVMATPKRDSPPKEQRRPKRRVRYKAEIVGSNIIVTREEASLDKKQEGAFDCSKAFAIERQVSIVKEGESSKGISAAKEPPIPTSEEETAVSNQSLEADLKTGQGAEGLNPAKADAFTQLSDDFATDVGDKLATARPCRNSAKCVLQTESFLRALVAVRERLPVIDKLLAVQRCTRTDDNARTWDQDT